MDLFGLDILESLRACDCWRLMPLSQVGPYVVFWAHACATGGREEASNGEGTNSNRISG